jgi:hypothetical protein
MFREVLEDIVAAGRRAGEIIRGIKGMLRKAEGARQLVDLNDVIAQTLSLTHSGALAHDCAVSTEFHPALPKVEADVVQLWARGADYFYYGRCQRADLCTGDESRRSRLSVETLPRRRTPVRPPLLLTKKKA